VIEEHETKDVSEFVRGQEDATALIVSAYRDVASYRERLRGVMVDAVVEAAAYPTAEEREEATISRIGTEFERHEDEIHRCTRQLLAGAAAASENWQRHAALLKNGPASGTAVADAIQAWTGLWEASTHAEASEDAFKASVEEFASVGPQAIQLVLGTLAASDGMRAATSELVALADEYLSTLREAWRAS